MRPNREYEVLFYETTQGHCPAEDFLDSLPVKVRAKLSKWIEKLEEHGPDLPRPYADVVRGKIRELRLIFSSNQYRLFYFFVGKKIIMTHGIMKKTDQIPTVELDRAQRAMQDFHERLKGGDIAL